ncbi:Uncharacterised protein [Mycobacteroides abscessus subsp. abscessus]|nr:Uncharacterised protein [Mycobacteroides abscessus subsp. abscessus]
MPKAIRVRFRIACTQTWGSLEQAWTTRSPSLEAARRFSSANRGTPSARTPGILAFSPKRSFPSASWNRLRPKPKVMLSPAGGYPHASPVSAGGLLGLASGSPPTSSPAHICSAATVQRASRSFSSATSVVLTS